MSVNYSRNIGAKKLTRDSLVRQYNSQSKRRAELTKELSSEKLESHKRNANRIKEREDKLKEFDKIRKEEETINAKKRAQKRDREAAEARSSAVINMNEAKSRKRSVISHPLTSQEFRDETMKNYEHYEKARAARDPFQQKRLNEPQRTVIDGRGTIDSRAFNERQIITNKSVDERDKHDPSLSTTISPHRWNTHSSKAYENSNKINMKINSLHLSHSKFQETIKQLPSFVKISIPIIIVLLFIAIILLTR